MAATTDPILGLQYGWAAGESGWNTGMDANLKKLAALAQLAVENVVNTPAVTTDGTRYIVGTSPTGDFAGQAGKVAVRVGSAWTFYTPTKGWTAYNRTTGTMISYNGTIWTTPVQTTPAQPILDASAPGSWTFSNAAWTKIPLYTVNTDSSGGWDASSNTDYTVPTTGLYLVQGRARPVRTGTGALADNVAVALGVGTSAADGTDVSWGSGPATGVLFTVQCQRLMRLSAGDKVFMFSKHGNSSPVGFSYARLNVLRISD